MKLITVLFFFLFFLALTTHVGHCIRWSFPIHSCCSPDGQPLMSNKTSLDRHLPVLHNACQPNHWSFIRQLCPDGNGFVIFTVYGVVLWRRGTEIGVVMHPSYMIRYQFDTSAGDISTDEENILIGFSTQEKRGTLMFVRSDSTPPEYISIEVNNNGLSACICFLFWRFLYLIVTSVHFYFCYFF